MKASVCMRGDHSAARTAGQEKTGIFQELRMGLTTHSVIIPVKVTRPLHSVIPAKAGIYALYLGIVWI
jgi:hypothetical protein